MNLNELRDTIHENAKAKGFYNDTDILHTEDKATIEQLRIIKSLIFTRKIALIHSELSEAIEADRVNNYTRDDASHALGVTWDNVLQLESAITSDDVFVELFEGNIKHTVQDELADAIIRILDLCGWLKIDIQTHVSLKMRYNKFKQCKKGKQY